MNAGFSLHSRLPVAALLTAGFFLAGSAAAQEEDYERIVTIMRACAQIDDVMARVSCYDNNIGAQSPASAQPSASSEAAPVQNAPAAPQGFGAEMVPAQRQQVREKQTDEVEARVSNSRMIEPGIYLITLEDGAQWQFSDSAASTYYAPRAGDTVRLERGALGSVFLHFDNQEGLRVRRLR